MFINLIIYFSVASSLFYFLIRNRIDFLLVFFLSTLLYHWQIIGGKIIVPPYTFKASSESMIILSTVLLTHMIITLFHDLIIKERITYKDISISHRHMAGTSNKFNNYLSSNLPMLVNNNKDFRLFKKSYDIYEMTNPKSPKKIAISIEKLLKNRKKY